MQTFGKLCFANFWQHFFLNSLQFLKNYFLEWETSFDSQILCFEVGEKNQRLTQ